MDSEAMSANAKILVVRTAAEADNLIAKLETSAAHVVEWLAGFQGQPMELLRHMKFDTVGVHPVSHHALNVIEQVNQTWTYVAALAGARQLFELHPEAAPFHLSPGAHAAQALDIISAAEGLVGAETFAAVRPENNRKLAKDLDKLSNRTEAHRYVFFMSPKYPGTRRLPSLERQGVQVWSVDIP